ncbi:flagellar hook-associated protein FlgK [Pseudomonas plecoglossicida]|uniref:flagellar hook-associated protein FlgK n=1 Tax=Pseudomonas plecoglossicida TaxID=70775 RepID=UPI000491F15A|nr:flagellar hook-associated protein FlgK [Pseudomonas plecoglossicida]GLR35349.1 flagellar hook-associated protein 1 [Pseudomonas plecoglossicida]
MSSMSQIGYSGIAAGQRGLHASAQNVANLNTPGYSRLTTVTGSLAGPSSLSAGGGVEVSEVRRIVDDFKNRQLWHATTEMHRYKAAQEYLGSLECAMDSEGASVRTGLDQFFAALSEASSRPADLPQRQQVLDETKSLTQCVNGLNSNIDDQLKALRGQRSDIVNEINGLAGNLARLNKKVVETQSHGGDSSVLQDERDLLIGKLSQYVDIRVTEARTGALSVSLADGLPMVSGHTAGQLSIMALAGGGQEVSLSFIDSHFVLGQSALGGALGGLHNVEHGELLEARERLGKMAQALTEMVNESQSRGYGLNGLVGLELLTCNPGNVTKLLQMNDLRPEGLAFADKPDEKGSNTVLLGMIELKNKKVQIQGNQVTLSEAFSSMLGQVASVSRCNQADLKTATDVAMQAQAQRDSVSAVSDSEEALAIMDYSKTVQANMKVIQVDNELFGYLLACF